MLPRLRPGDRLLILHGRSPRPGHVVVARLPDGTVAIKRVDVVDEDGHWLISDNVAEGWSSRAHGAPVPTENIVAVAVARLWPRPGRLRRVSRIVP